MENRTVGMVLLGVSALIGFIIFSFNRALTDIVGTACSHGEACPMWGTIEFQTNVSLGILAVVAAFAFYLIFFNEDSVQKTVPKANLKGLGKDEKLIVDKIVAENGTIFQSALVEKTSFPKAKVTRILDKLEGKGIIERKRRGMSNVVVLKH